MYDNTYSNKGSAFYLLRSKGSIPGDKDLIDLLYIKKAELSLYEKTIGPIPLDELSKELPNSLAQIPPLIWNNTEWINSRCRTKTPKWGDFIICVEGNNTRHPLITGGFFTTKTGVGIYKKDCQFVTWSSTKGNRYGFVYCAQHDMHPTIVSHILNEVKYTNERT